MKFAQIYDQLLASSKGMPELPEVMPSLEEIFSSLDFDDNWDEAFLVDVCRYLRGGKNLLIPESFRPLLPKDL